jgi:hypothetical protein
VGLFVMFVYPPHKIFHAQAKRKKLKPGGLSKLVCGNM